MSNNTQLAQLNDLLKSQNADYSILTDDFSIEKAEEGAKHYGISLSETTPTLILKTKEKYFAAIICGNSRIAFKKLKQALGIKDISLADPHTVLQITGANVGEVSLINIGLTTIVDKNVLMNKNCYGGCGVPKTTLRINTHDLVRISGAQILEFTEPRS
ncbi:MAG TPA: YbaK/EbsC family protein [Gammaproteobacteria bacterium]|jgi:prolyl-tRNA editing enzyme YbaK/EbsC (Cys-tRNA(Pro) deacylase)|nr:YbaK/EbsC family protein [Gammaproteobacteria bacterium]